MPSSCGMVHRVALVRTDVSEELSSKEEQQCASVASYANVVPSSPILVTLMIEVLSSSEMSFLTRFVSVSVMVDVDH
jgi:hypothetical protein